MNTVMFQLNQVYRTRMQDGSMFRVIANHTATTMKGYYLGYDGLLCPIDKSRLIPIELAWEEWFPYWYDQRLLTLKWKLTSQTLYLEGKYGNNTVNINHSI